MKGTLYLNCKSSGICGQLISIALVDIQHKNNFYKVADYSWFTLNKYAREHIIPNLNQKEDSLKDIQSSLVTYLNGYTKVKIICNSSEDMRLFLSLIYTEVFKTMVLNKITFKLIKYDYESTHNSLEDAYQFESAFNTNLIFSLEGMETNGLLCN